MRTRAILFLIFISIADSFCQNRNSVWCFGDSALIDFSDTANITTGTSKVKSRGSCASICDANGQLLFYVSYDPTVIISGTDPVKAYNRNHLVMMNGDSMKGGGWYHEIVVIPYPGSDSLFYIFCIGVTLDYGLYYSIVDISSNGGLGAVIQKNVQLQNFKCSDGLTAIKHGNGRDWWIIFRRWDTVNNTFYKYLISPTGISSSITQNIGTATDNGFGRIQFSNDGSKMLFYDLRGLMELYDFDRCTGVISNTQTIYPEQTSPFSRYFWGATFSPSGNLLYATTIPIVAQDTSRLLQLDLTATNIALSADTLRETMFIETQDGLKLAPDGRIYFATSYYQVYPYADSMYNNINTHLSTINSPDSLGAACNLQLYNFYLGGNRTYGNLPNNPDYELGSVSGSICDSLTGITVNETQIKNELFVYYNSSWQKAFINAKGLKGRNAKMSVFDLLGNVIYTEESKLTSQYFTKDLNMAAYAKGMYIVNLVTEKERLVKKFIKD